MLSHPKFKDYLIDRYFMSVEEVEEMQTMHFESMFTFLVDEVILFLEEKDMQDELKHLDSLTGTKSKGKLLMRTHQKLLEFIVGLPNKYEELAKRVAERLETFERESFFEMFDLMNERQQLELIALFQDDIRTMDNNANYYLELLKNSDV